MHGATEVSSRDEGGYGGKSQRREWQDGWTDAGGSEPMWRAGPRRRGCLWLGFFSLFQATSHRRRLDCRKKGHLSACRGRKGWEQRRLSSAAVPLPASLLPLLHSPLVLPQQQLLRPPRDDAQQPTTPSRLWVLTGHDSGMVNIQMGALFFFFFPPVS